MLGQNAFYYESLRKYILAFGAIFNDIHVIRTDENENQIKDIRVPIKFATKNKMSQMIQSQQSTANSSLSVSTILPQMSFRISNLTRDYTRKVSSLNETVISDNETTQQFLYSGIPYNVTFSLGVWTKYLSDTFQIIEQILTFFHPDYTITVKEIPTFDIQRDIPVVLGDTQFDFEADFGEDSWRNLQAEIEFTLQGWLYPPIKESGIITLINNRIRNGNTDNIDSLLRHQYDNVNDIINSTFTNATEDNFEQLLNNEVQDNYYEETLKVYNTTTEPTLGTEKIAMWRDTSNKNKKYLIYKNVDGTQTVVPIELVEE